MKKIYFFFLLIVLIFSFLIIFKFNQKKFYKNIKLIKNPDNILVLVNKNNKLPAVYVPYDLMEIPNNMAYNGKKIRKEALENFSKLFESAKLENYKIIVVSAYRDYEYQKKLFNSYVNEKGINYALKCSAKAGHSEHQTGLAIDVMGSNNDYNLFGESKEFEWMKKNAYKYGFILRYPKDKENITGFKYEPWHYRYVGIEASKYIYEKNITLEEYFSEKGC